jgi:hypothetical protein
MSAESLAAAGEAFAQAVQEWERNKTDETRATVFSTLEAHIKEMTPLIRGELAGRLEMAATAWALDELKPLPVDVPPRVFQEALDASDRILDTFLELHELAMADARAAIAAVMRDRL